MKRLFHLLFAALLPATPVAAQTLVSTSVLPRNAVLEMFNGINCAYCPDGDLRANQLANAFPGRVVRIIFHTGVLADTIFPGQPDYRTPYGAAIDSLSGGNAYPSGTMNRVVWPGTYSQPPYFPQNPPNKLAIRRQGWWDGAYPTTGTGAAIILNGGNTPVNIGAETIWNDITRELTVNVELYYTSSDTVANKLNVVYLENGIIGLQSTTNGYDSSYVHNHMVRDMITGQWGDTVTTVQQGTLVSRTYSYVVPVNFNIDNSEIAVYVTQENNLHTHTSALIAAKNGTSVGMDEILKSETFSVYPNPATTSITISGLTDQAGEITVINILGKTIMKLIPVNGALHADISKLPSGLYFVCLAAGEDRVVKKFIKE